MKEFVKEFFLRGFIACGFGPLALAAVYMGMQKGGVLNTLTVNQVCTGIFSIAMLAFLAGGLNAIYKVERLPLPMAILIHGIVLYVAYLVTYLLNDWLRDGWMPLLIFTVIFVVGYLIIWAVIYCVIRSRAAKLNALLQQRQAGEY